MNHMLLSRRRVGEGLSDLSGVNAMELVINDMIKLGAYRNRLVAKVFGGARMVKGLSDIGEENVNFTLGFLEAEGIACLGKSVGGDMARQLLFMPHTGVVRQRFVQDAPLEERPVTASEGNDLELL
jgi:chemotaxis protein CheD